MAFTGIKGAQGLKNKAGAYFAKNPDATWKAMTGLQYGAGYSLFALQDALDKNWQMETGEAIQAAQDQKMIKEGQEASRVALENEIASGKMSEEDVLLGMPQLKALLDTQKDRKAKMSGDQGGTSDPKVTDDFCIDHDHETDKVRGLLCSSCNLMLGKAKADAGNKILLGALFYLKAG